eukprot:TRINITY_DN1648_c0_g2_i1.p2 TRINITY_DN1648_c0_g2~~TRINITY_DN1648_c0_g2_i1.p2  ORF type:complete len:2183 (-),score=603.76 TRINITY_DN1648_c0_g2_i1:51-6599(-)
MAEERAGNRAREVKANANLVLQSENRSRAAGEATGEPESLRGRTLMPLGDRSTPARAAAVKEKIKKKAEKKKKVVRDEIDRDIARGLHTGPRSVIEATQEDSKYTPKTKQTKAVFDNLLGFIQTNLGDQPQEFIRSAADEVLSVIFNEKLTAPQKKKELSAVFDSLSEEKFAELTQLCLKITDYAEVTEATQEGVATTIDSTVSVVFESDNEDEDEDEEMEEIMDSEDDEEGEDTMITGHEEDEERARREKSGAKVEEESIEVTSKSVEIESVDPATVDAFWLQRKIHEFITDADAAKSLSEKVLVSLSFSSINKVNNSLVELLGLEQVHFISLLLKNRLTIVYCTRLARAASPEEKAKIEQEMSANPQTLEILRKLAGSFLHGVQNAAAAAAAAAEASGEGKSAQNQKDAKMGGDNSQNVTSARLLNLDDLTFDAGSHFMSKKECRLPSGSFRQTHKGYEEVGIPMPNPPKGDDKLVAIKDLPEWVQPIFGSYKTLTRIQSRIFQTAFYQPDNMLVCAPTGSGKTNVAMLTMLHEIGLHRGEDGSVDVSAFKIVYVAPMKSLVQEMVGNFSQRLSPLGITVKELSGDISLTKAELSETQVIVTTPEKWDIITRKAGDRAYTELVRLVIIDEVHLLHDSRGPVIEGIVSRTIRHIEQTKNHVRIVGLSATLPGYEDVGAFLRVKPEHIFAFDNSYRPVPLEQTYIGVTEKSALKRYKLMNEIAYEKILQHAGKHQVLVFVHSRKETAKTAKELRDMAVQNDETALFAKEGATREIISQEVREIKNAELREVLPYGFAIHHAGLAREDRTRVEELFSDGHIQVLVSTATLAWGVNLPAHTVIIRGTQVYSPERGRWIELGPLDVMQMIGRAGRPQFDTEGRGIIITAHTELQYYLSLLNHQLPIESQLLSSLPDSLNAEIVLGNVQNIREAAHWLTYTYLHVCMIRNPALYGIPLDEAERDPTLEQRRIDLVHSAAVTLDKTHLIRYDRKTGVFQVTDLGRVASHFYISHHSMAKYNEHLKPTMNDIDLFRLFSLSNEFALVPVRGEEKGELEKLLEKVPIPIKESVEEPAAKINVLLQAYISRLKLEGLAMTADMVYVSQSAGRISRALFEIVLRRGWAQLAEKTLTLCKMIEHRMWLSQSPLRQFRSIPEDIVHRLERQDFELDHLYPLTSQDLGSLVNSPQFGHQLFTHVHAFPKLEVFVGVQPITRSVLRIELAISPDFAFNVAVHGPALGFHVLVEDGDCEQLLHHEFFVLKHKYSQAGEPHLLSFTVPIFEPLPPQYFIKIVADRWMGSEIVLPVSLRHLILPEKYPPHTELFDLRPLPITSLGVPQYIALYNDRISSLNPIQTQTFPALYDSNENVLVAAPATSGKTFCAELAMMHLWNSSEEEHPLIVYIAPIASQAHERFREWNAKFGKGLGKTVIELTGEETDVIVAANADIVVATPEQWDYVSRGYDKKRNPTKKVKLFIVDDLHLINEKVGPTLEFVITRMRFIASQLKEASKTSDEMKNANIRFVALSHSLANANDLAEWIGATPKTMFNFHPNVRFIPLEIHMQGFDNPNYASRMTSMARPTIQAIRRHAAGKPVIVFVPSKRHVMWMVKELSSWYDPDEHDLRFLKVSLDELKPILENVKSRSLKESLQCGIGFLHEGMSERERDVVCKLASTGATQVLVASQEQCWGLPVSAHTVIVMGTEYPNGKQYDDYPITTILQMMGRSTRPGVDQTGKCVILCYTPKKNYYIRFLNDSLPIESSLHHALADHINAEIVNKAIENSQDVVDFLTYTFFFRRLTKNPNYYNLTGTTMLHVSDYLSELVSTTLADLESADCIRTEEQEVAAGDGKGKKKEILVDSLNFGMLAKHFYVQYSTVELFKKSLTEKTKLKGLIDILANATEFGELPIRHHEEGILKKLAAHLPAKIESPDYKDPHTKANVLLQTHFSRTPLPGDLAIDQAVVLGNAHRLVRAMVDVIASSGWLTPAIAAMEMSQMIIQGMWNSDSILKQVPHLSDEIIARLDKADVKDIYSLMDMDDDDRRKILSLPDKNLVDVAEMCNRYPNIDITFDSPPESPAGENVIVSVQLQRAGEEGDSASDIPLVYSPYYPKEKHEGWWAIISDPKAKTLFTLRWVSFATAAKLKLDFTAPTKPGKYDLMLTLMSCAYVGCDQEYEFSLEVSGNADGDAQME